ncbi:EF-P lysine aminoacylase EpmA [Nitrospirillum pindoramense]|uniref:Lysyl-tRNA synthetase class 2 n=1 Tax=Nitrospirillum amazonense TaxID=28077 RepID=A0A560HFD4_9PROT|nr:EF-P lysine aminoacylase EpmA [Nitrospirillum amazonense]TWB45123.1 lysyl-tRNA synthetase class 2 [Nitrospirillum amazonense]
MKTRTQPWWHPDRMALRAANLKARGAMTRALRRWFENEDFEEVETPALQVSPGLEPHLMAFATELVGSHPDDRLTLRLHTSPEFTMKKLLVAGLPRIFQLAHVYRNGERSPTHSPEFAMLEWYRVGAGYRDLMDDCIGLTRALCAAAGVDILRRGDLTCDPLAAWEVLTVQEAFQRHVGIDLLATAPDPARPDVALLAQAAEAVGIHAHAGDTWEDLFFRISLDRIEPHLGMGRPTFLTDYPVSMAALSRPKPEDGRVAERFELYACGVELANAFGELTDAAVQKARFEADMDLKQALYGERYPIDADFLAALEFGLPDCAGIALGFDRLVMLATNAAAIDDVLWAPVALP